MKKGPRYFAGSVLIPIISWYHLWTSRFCAAIYLCGVSHISAEGPFKASDMGRPEKKEWLELQVWVQYLHRTVLNLIIIIKKGKESIALWHPINCQDRKGFFLKARVSASTKEAQLCGKFGVWGISERKRGKKSSHIGDTSRKLRLLLAFPFQTPGSTQELSLLSHTCPLTSPLHTCIYTYINISDLLHVPINNSNNCYWSVHGQEILSPQGQKMD